MATFPTGDRVTGREGRRTVGSRLLALLDVFTADQPQLMLSEISRLADVPLSTAHRLVGELTAWGASSAAWTGSIGSG